MACRLYANSLIGVSVKRDGWTPLHWASRVGSLDIVRLLAKYGANVNVKDRWGTTPLMLTVVGENRGAAETLIELGADIDARNVSAVDLTAMRRNERARETDRYLE